MNEKMMILKMLEEGKITAAEAARLLESVEPENRQEKQTVKPAPAPPAAKPAPPPVSVRTEPRDNRQTPPPAGGFDEFTGDLSKKFEQFARDMEPKLYKLTETVAEKTSAVADKISKSLSQTPPRETPGVKKSYSNMEERSFESFVTPGYNELSLSGLNGDVLIKGYNGDKISARIYYKTKKPGAYIDIIQLGTKYFLNYEEDEFEKVSIDAFVPETMFNNINIQTINGQLSVSSLRAENCVFVNTNAATEIKDIDVSNFKIECSNGALRLENIRGSSGKAENFNGSVQGTAIDVANLELISQNGSVGINIASFDRYSDYVWAVEASNGKLTLNMPSSRDLGYHIKAHTALNSIRVGLTGLSYMFNEPSFVEAKSSAYDICSKKIKLSMETSNAPIILN